tara:strand:+ start:6257 stop:7297 length:1041 start_codon:yes stop_codon:yes gene_type:complete
MKKIKVFLGGFVNSTNAQNLNCKAIADYLNKNKFKVYALRTHFGNNEYFNYKTFFCFKPISITYHFGFLWGIIKSDILYLPKHVDTPIWVLRFAKFLKRPIFTTIEGVVIDVNQKYNLVNLFSSKHKMQKHFSYFDAIFGINKNIINNARKTIKIQNKSLSLGVDIERDFIYSKKKLRRIVYVGGLIKRKRVKEFIKLAGHFPDLHFDIVGDGPEKNRLLELATKNINFKGFLEHDDIKSFLKVQDLLFLPSKSEGFPKVILEAASVGIPSIVYDSYGASEWMQNNKNGFIVKDFQNVIDIIDKLIKNPHILHSISINVIELARTYDWNIIIKEWEKVIVNLFNEK